MVTATPAAVLYVRADVWHEVADLLDAPGTVPDGLFGTGMLVTAETSRSAGAWQVSDVRRGRNAGSHGLTTGPSPLVFHAGVPLRSQDSGIIGVLRVADNRPRRLSRARMNGLLSLADQITVQLALRRRSTDPSPETDRPRRVAVSSGLQECVLDVSEIVAQRDRYAADAERWRSLILKSPTGIALVDENYRFAVVNPAMCDLLGRSEAELVGLPAAISDHENATEGVEDQRVSSGGRVGRVEITFTHPSGEQRWAYLTYCPIAGPDGRSWYMGHVIDITSRKAAEHALSKSEASLSAVVSVIRRMQSGEDPRETIVEAAVTLADASFAALIEPNSNDLTLTVSAATYDVLNGLTVSLDRESATTSAFLSRESIFIADAVGHPLALREMVDLANARSIYLLPVMSGADVLAVLMVAWRNPVADLGDRRASAVTSLADQAGVALRQGVLLSELEQLAHHDQLTALMNRRGWDRHLARHISAADRTETPLTLALADLDFFKRYNDQHGHQAGDELLREFAAAALASVRVHDVVARWGGEEFAVALPDCSSDNARAVLERIRGVVPHGQTCSIGFATRQPGESPQDVLARADRALYLAKTGGRNQIRSGDVHIELAREA